jgi:hypothetical protein
MRKKKMRERINPDTCWVSDAMHSRRDFIHSLSAAGFGLIGMGAFLDSCGGKESGITSGLAKAYLEAVQNLVKQVLDRELPSILKAAALAIQSKKQGHLLYAKMTDGMLPGETSVTRPGMANIYQTGELHLAVRDDFVVTNDPYEANGLTERLITVAGISKPSILSRETPKKVLENMGTFRIEDVSSLVIYTHVPPQDGILQVKGLDYPLGPMSGIIETCVFHALTAEIVEGLAQEGIYPKVG